MVTGISIVTAADTPFGQSKSITREILVGFRAICLMDQQRGVSVNAGALGT